MKYNIETQIKSYVIESLFPFLPELNRWHEKPIIIEDTKYCNGIVKNILELKVLKKIKEKEEKEKKENKYHFSTNKTCIAKESCQILIKLFKAYKSYLKDNPSGKIKLSFI